jgi:hypothetical protein
MAAAFAGWRAAQTLAIHHPKEFLDAAFSSTFACCFYDF